MKAWIQHREPARNLEPLLDLLEEWGEHPEPSSDFDSRLARRIAQAAAEPRQRWRDLLSLRPPRLLWAPAAASLALLVCLGLFLYLGANPDQPNPAQALQLAQVNFNSDPMMRDLQVLSRDHDLLDHLDFLSVPVTDPVPHPTKD
ncbi:MAG: hypothetical protein ACRD1E_00355 [Terriglobales bacterium]